MPLAYNPHAVCSKLGREPPPAALARLHGGARKSRFRCLSISSAAAHAHSKQLANGLERAEVLPTLPLADELLQPPLRANLPNA